MKNDNHWVVQYVFDHKMFRYQDKVHNGSDRIVNIYQPHVRLMVRGKDRDNVEFGTKINFSEVDGLIRCDQLGWDNRRYLKGHGFRIAVKQFGRSPKEKLSGSDKYKPRKEQYVQNHAEGKSGQGKSGFGLSMMRGRRQDTSESWISAILFGINLTKLMKLALKHGYFLPFFIWSYIRKISWSENTKFHLSGLSVEMVFT